MTEQCDVDDILCQLRILEHLRSLQKDLGNKKLLEEFPEFRGIDERLSSKIITQKGAVKEALERCGNLSEDMAPPEIYDEIYDSDWDFSEEED